MPSLWISRRFFSCAALLLSMLLSATSLAAGPLQVEGMQPPVWVQYEGKDKQPLFPGQSLKAGVRITTGQSGKAILRLGEGSLVKLGSAAIFRVSRLEQKQRPAATAESSQEKGFFDAALEVVEGAFRFTTTEIGKQWGRDVGITLGSVATIGIRGTDVWGQVASDKSFVVLLEGHISVDPVVGDRVELKKPLDIYSAPEGEAGTVDKVPMSAVKKLAPETELDSGKGVMRANGAYRSYLASFVREKDARIFQQQLRTAGYPAQTWQAQVKGNTWHRVGAQGFVSLEDARYFGSVIGQHFAVDSAWEARF